MTRPSSISRKFLAARLIFTTSLLMSGLTLHAQPSDTDLSGMTTRRWKDPVSGSWSDTAKWDPSGVPVSTDSVIIDRAGSYTVTISSSVTIAGLAMGDSGGIRTLAITSGTFTHSAPAIIGSNSVVQLDAPARLIGSSDFDVRGGFVWTGGSIEGSGVLLIDTAGTLTINSGSGVELVSERTLRNDGTMRWLAGNIWGRFGGEVENHGLFEIENNGSMYTVGFEGRSRLTNTGTMRKVAGTGVTEIGGSNGFTFDNNGAVEVQTGTLRLGDNFADGSVSNGTFLVNAGARLEYARGNHLLTESSSITTDTLQIVAGSVEFKGTAAIGTIVTGGRVNLGTNLTIPRIHVSAGGLGGTGTLTVTDSMTWTGGTMNGSGTLIIDTGAVLAVNPAGTVEVVSEWLLRNDGTMRWLSGNIQGRFGGDVENHGLFEIHNNGSMYTVGFEGRSRLTNTGTMRKAAGTGVTEIGGSDGFTFDNNGLVEVQTGTLRLGDLWFDGSVNDGTFLVGDGAHLEYARGKHLLTQSSVIGGAGTLTLVSVEVSFAGRFSPGDPVGVLTMSGNFTAAPPQAGIDVDILGPDPGTGYDQLVVNNVHTLGGVLKVAVDTGYAPPDGTRFEIIRSSNGSTIAGSFTGFEGMVSSQSDYALYLSREDSVVALETVSPIPVMDSSIVVLPETLAGGAVRTVRVAGGNFTYDVTARLECDSCAFPELFGAVDGQILSFGIDSLTVQFDLTNPFYSGNYSLILENPRGGYAATVLRITPPPIRYGVFAEDALASEAGNDPATFLIRANQPVPADVPVSFTLGGSAAPWCDYMTDIVGTAAVIRAGETDARIMILPLSESLVETTETVVMTLTGADITPTASSASIILLDGPAIDDFQVKAFFPRRGGESSGVILRIVGQGIENGATVQLVKGGSVHAGTSPTVNPEGTFLAAIFDLPPKSAGLWDVVVENPGHPPVVLPGAFTVEALREPEFWVDITGPTVFRSFLPPQTYHLTVTNRGNGDAVGVPVWIVVSRENLPDAAILEPLFPVTMPDPPPGLGITSWSDPLLGADTLSTLIRTDQSIVLAFVIPVLPAGSSITYPFLARTYNIRAWVNEPFFTGLTAGDSLSGKWGSVVTASAMAASGKDVLGCALAIGGAIVGSIPAAGCGTSLGLLGASTAAGLVGLGLSPSANSGGQLVSGMISGLAGVVLTCGSLACPPCAAGLTVAGIVGGIVGVIDACSPFIGPKPQGSVDVDEISATDPNDKLGPAGGDLASVGASRRFVSGIDPFGYLIRFENVDTATAPAIEVLVKDTLNPDHFDLESFELGSMRFGSRTVDVPPGLSSYSAAVPLEGTPYKVVIASALEKATGVAFWRFTTIDTTTGLLPTDPMAGFLPPNLTPPEGEGSVFFRVRLRAGLSDGTEITNRALIHFDVEAPIATPEWINTLDAAAPTSSVGGLVKLQGDTLFSVGVSGEDAEAGIAFYEVYVSRDSLPFELWRVVPGTDTAAVFDGEPGAHYSFYSIAHDAAGNAEPPKSDGEASTLVTGIGRDESLPTQYHLAQNYPNPFNPSTTIRFDVPSTGWVSLRVFDILGREVARLVDAVREPGRHAAVFEAAALPGGVYFYTLRSGSFVANGKMLLLK